MSTQSETKNAPAGSNLAAGDSNEVTELRQGGLTCLLLGIATFLVFARVTGFDFITFDDPDFVTNNLHVQHGFNGEDLKWAVTSMFNYWQPLVWLSYMLDYQFFGLSAAAFHFTNLALHILNTVLLFLVFRKMTRSQWGSVLVAALFAFHPLHVEAVAWISERKGLLSTTFWILTIFCYLRYTEKRSAAAHGLMHVGARRAGDCAPYPEKNSAAAYVVLLLAFIGGVMSKSMIVTLPCVLLLLDLWPLQRLQLGKDTAAVPRTTVPLWKLLLEKAPLFLLAGVSAFLTMSAQRQIGTVWSLEQISMARRIGHMLVEYVVYLRKTLWPNDLGVFYPYPPPWPIWQVAGAGVILGGISLATLLAIRKRPYLVVGWFWFLGILFPVMGLFQVGEAAMADRYMYIALTGLSIMAIWGGADLLSHLRLPQPAQKALACGAVLACVMSTSFQLRHWQNSRTLFEHTAEVTGPNYLAYAVLGDAMSREGRFQEAMEYFNSSLALQPTYPDTLFAAGNACFQAKRFKEAAEYFKKTVEVRPDFMEAHFHFAMALQVQGQVDGAIIHYKKALELQPGLARGHLLLGDLLQPQGKLDEALGQFKEAVRLKPDWPEALNRLAWLLVIHPDPAKRNPQEALRLSMQSCQLTQYQDVPSLNALAGAYSELGDFAQAQQTAGKALELAQAGGKPQVIEMTRKLQQLYRQKRPCRELK